jgi:hypothetical protein
MTRADAFAPELQRHPEDVASALKKLASETFRTAAPTCSTLLAPAHGRTHSPAASVWGVRSRRLIAAMPVREPFEFSVTHVGRGGEVTCRCDAGTISLAIELEAGGEFSVWLRGARLVSDGRKERALRADERRLVLERLRAWLEATGREGWAVE